MLLCIITTKIITTNVQKFIFWIRMSLILPRYQALTKNIKAIIAWMPQRIFLFPMESKRV